MGFFAKVKQWLGFVGMDVTLECPQSLANDAQEISGKVTFVGKSDQFVEGINVVFEEKWERGKGEDKKTEVIKLGEVKIPAKYDLKAGESKTVDFALVFKRALSTNQSMAQAGGVIGGLGKLGSMMDSERSTYKVTATIDLKGVALDPSDSKDVIFK